MASVIVLAILVLFFNQLDYRLIRKPAIDAQKKAAAVKAKADQEAADTTAETTTASVIAVGDNLYHQSLIDAGASSDATGTTTRSTPTSRTPSRTQTSK